MKSTLNEIILSNNGFIGCLPAEIGSWSEVTVLDASFNSFSGVLPETFAGLKKLESLNIAHNMLTGMVPCSVSGIKSLGNFKLSDNYFKGAASECTSRSDLVFDDEGKRFLERGQQKSFKACVPVQMGWTKCDIDATPPPVYSPPLQFTLDRFQLASCQLHCHHPSSLPLLLAIHLLHPVAR